ncbi:serine protease [SAR92 clade bacterium H921]|nr:serine protease [SAR92 clade bacterium H921]
MAHQLSISEQLAHSTVRIETTTSAGSCQGTGFFYHFAINGENGTPAIVTNKHVVQGAISGKFVLTEKDENNSPVMGKYHELNFDDFGRLWTAHPNPDIDLCVMPIAPILNEANSRKLNFFCIYINKSDLLTSEELHELTAMEDVVMVGYPNGMWDQANNMPIVRKGITATHPNIDWNGNPESLIDAACFPGSSGSPVFLFNQSGYSSKTGVMVIGKSRVKLLGILRAGFKYPIKGETEVVQVPIQNISVPVSPYFNNLGIVIKASQLEAFEAIFRQGANAT